MFDCTVVEPAGGLDKLMKSWVLDDTPDVYAKIIMDKPGKYEHLHI